MANIKNDLTWGLLTTESTALVNSSSSISLLILSVVVFVFVFFPPRNFHVEVAISSAGFTEPHASHRINSAQNNEFFPYFWFAIFLALSVSKGPDAHPRLPAVGAQWFGRAREAGDKGWDYPAPVVGTGNSSSLWSLGLHLRNAINSGSSGCLYSAFCLWNMFLSPLPRTVSLDVSRCLRTAGTCEDWTPVITDLHNQPEIEICYIVSMGIAER